MNLLKRIPLPMAGLALGLAALGNLFAETPVIRTVLGIIAAIILVVLAIKVILIPQSLKEAIDTPPVAGTLMTYPMAMMVLSGYILPHLASLAKVLWFAGIALFLLLLAVFIPKYILKFNIKCVFASYFVAFVGIVVASLTANAMGFPLIGKVAFWFGLICYILLLVPVTYRYLRVKNSPPPATPAVAIYAAPASLLLAGYLSVFETKAPAMVYALFAVALIMTLVGLIQSIPQLTKPFYPSIAAFTFPFVISAIATKMMNGYLNASGNPSSLVSFLFKAEFVIAVLLVAYTLIRYMIFLSNSENKLSMDQSKKVKQSN